MRNTKVWTSSIGDAYGKIVGAEARVKSRGNRSLWRGRRRVATDVDGRKSTRVAPIFLRRSIDPQKSACIENPTYEPFTNARLFRKDSSWKRYFQGRILFLSQLNVLLRKGRCFINIFSLCFFSAKKWKAKICVWKIFDNRIIVGIKCSKETIDNKWKTCNLNVQNSKNYLHLWSWEIFSKLSFRYNITFIN